MRRSLFAAEALAALALASLLIAALPFRRVAGLMAGGSERRPADAPTARRIDRALWWWSRRVPWRAVCFQQGLAAQMMLRRRRRAATIHYGATHDASGRLIAHVWVTSGPVEVVGCEGVDRYGLLATFPPSR